MLCIVNCGLVIELLRDIFFRNMTSENLKAHDFNMKAAKELDEFYCHRSSFKLFFNDFKQ